MRVALEGQIRSRVIRVRLPKWSVGGPPVDRSGAKELQLDPEAGTDEADACYAVDVGAEGAQVGKGCGRRSWRKRVSRFVQSPSAELSSKVPVG